jgi:uncharacterized protein YuzE
MSELGATPEEVAATIREGERFPAKFGRAGFRRNFAVHTLWRGRRYHMKQIEVYAIWEDGLARDQCNRQVFLNEIGGRRVQLSYDPRRNIAYLRLRETSGIQLETVRLSDEVNVDLAPDGSVCGIELLNANTQLRACDGGRFVLVDEVAGSRIEIPLPEVA